MRKWKGQASALFAVVSMGLSGAVGCAAPEAPEAASTRAQEALVADAIPTPSAGAVDGPRLIPAPVEVVAGVDPGELELGPTVRVAWSAGEAGDASETGTAVRAEARRIARWLGRGTGWHVPVARGEDAGVSVQLRLGEVELAGDEAYELVVGDAGVSITARTPTGLFRGFQTLRKLLPVELEQAAAEPRSEPLRIPRVRVVDAPRFRWRGLHLDVGRHLFSVAEIERLLDTMALVGLNVFHWHLTEDQGWRIEIRSHPRLTSVGAYRSESPVRGDRSRGDGVPYGGFYTQDDVREVVAYAARLHIDVMPEIELPGHSTAAVAAYPELGNPEFVEDAPEVATRWGVTSHTLFPSEATLRFYEDVFDEVMALFPFEFIHVGGDEAPKTEWRESPTVQARMAELGLHDEDQVQAWFIGHFARYFEAHGRRLVGWDEIQEGGLPAGATMMVWRGWHYGVEAVRAGHDIVMAPTSHTYFDYYQGPPAHEPEAIGGLLPLERVYDFEPVPPELSADEATHVLGAQGQLWTEYIPDAAQLEYMAFPRALVLAEVLWSPKEGRDFDDFRRRLDPLLARLDALGIGYRIPEFPLDVDAVVFTDHVRVPLPRAAFALRLAGDEDWIDSRTLSTDALVTETTRSFELARLASDGRVGPPSTLTLLHVDSLSPDAGPLTPGLTARELPGAHRDFPTDADFASATPAPTTTPFAIHPATALRLDGFLEVDAPGLYTLSLTSDDGSRLSLAGELLLDNGGLHGAVTRTARVVLPKGRFPLRVEWFDAGGAASLAFGVDGPGEWRLFRSED